MKTYSAMFWQLILKWLKPAGTGFSNRDQSKRTGRCFANTPLGYALCRTRDQSAGQSGRQV